MRAAVLHCEGERHHLDHLCPLAIWLALPMLFTDPQEKKRALAWYPGLQAREIEPIDCDPERLYAQWDLLLYSNWMALPGKAIFVPHGHSDKGEHSWWMEAFAQEDAALILGPRMHRILEQKKALPRVTIPVGPWRKRETGPPEKTILYAPTWGADNSLLLEELEHVPQGYQLVVKLHPRVEMDQPGLVERIKALKGVQVAPSVPHIFPLLQRACCLISDVSSLVYDFLHFDRPIVLLSRNGLRYSSHDFSTVVPRLWEGVVEAIENDRHSAARKEGLADAFYPQRSAQEVLADIEAYARS